MISRTNPRERTITAVKAIPWKLQSATKPGCAVDADMIRLRTSRSVSCWIEVGRVVGMCACLVFLASLGLQLHTI